MASIPTPASTEGEKEEKEHRSLLALCLLHQIQHEMEEMHVPFLDEKEAAAIGAARMQVLQLPIAAELRALSSLEAVGDVGRILARTIRGSIVPRGPGLVIAAINVHVSHGLLIVQFTTVSRLIWMLAPLAPPALGPQAHNA